MCDCLVALPAATESGVTRFAKNSDRPPDEAQLLEWLPPRRDESPVRTTYMEVGAAPGFTLGVLGSRPWWMWGLEHGVNEAGVAIGNEAIFTTLDPGPFPPRLTGMDLVRLGLERGESAKGALDLMTELLEKCGQGGSCVHGSEHAYWSSFLIADASDAWVLETSGTTWEAERVGGTRAISNRTTIASFDAEHRNPEMPTEIVTDPRLRSSEAVLAKEPVTLQALKLHLRDHRSGEGGFSVCMHVPGTFATTASIVAELGEATPSGRPIAHVCLGAPCVSLFVPVVVGRPLGSPPEWGHLAGLGPARRGELDALEAELEASASSSADSDEWAPTAWSRVEAILDLDGVVQSDRGGGQ